MDSVYIPKTEIELENWMKENCHNSSLAKWRV
jgi:hypothetical protein